MSISVERFKELVEKQGKEVTSYSGRGMYGKYCAGVILPMSCIPGFVAFAVANASSEEQEDLAELFDSACFDSMGYDVIMYFPDIPYSEDKVEKEGEEEEDEE